MRFILALLSVLWGSVAMGQIVVDLAHVNGRLDPELSLGLSNVRYKYESDYSETTRRTIVGLGLSIGVVPGMNLILQTGLVPDTNIGNDVDGSGYMLGAGFNGVFMDRKPFMLIGYTIFNYIRENYWVRPKVTEEARLSEAHVGFLARFRLTERAYFYAGPDAVAYSEGKLAADDNEGGKIRYKRDKMVNLKLGFMVAMGRYIIKPEITALGEESILLVFVVRN